MSNIEVQIVCVTYNQEKFIKDALDSFLMQKTNFKFEVLVGDDCSTDETSQIVAEYAKKYPDIIKHIKREKNIGPLNNFVDLCKRITAKYAAFCDGDDYWTYEYKLQKQYDFMEKHKNFGACFHRVKILCNRDWALYDYYSKNGTIIPQIPRNYSKHGIYTVKAVFNEIPHTSSFFIRWDRNLFYNARNLINNESAGDIWALFPQLTNTKNSYLFDDFWSIYNRIGTGITFSQKDLDTHFLKTRKESVKVFFCLTKFSLIYNKFGEIVYGRLLREVKNYLNVIKKDRWDLLIKLKETDPEIYNLLNDMLSGYKIRLKLLQHYGKAAADLFRKHKFLKKLKIFIYFIKVFYVKKIRICYIKKKKRNDFSALKGANWSDIISFIGNISKENNWAVLEELYKEEPKLYKMCCALLSEHEIQLKLLQHYGKTTTDLFRVDDFLEKLKPTVLSLTKKNLLDNIKDDWNSVINFVNLVYQSQDWELLLKLKDLNFFAYLKACALFSEFNLRISLSQIYNKETIDLFMNDKFLKKLKPCVFFIKNISDILSKLTKINENILAFVMYWVLSLVPKKKNLWCFSGFIGNNYFDNTKYLYEYILKNHPAINAIWITKNNNILSELKEKNFPTLKMSSIKGIWTMARASIAFVDHYKMSDFPIARGINSRTKVVQLWHGVGLKGMHPDGYKIPYTTVEGVRMSGDILSQRNDNLRTRIIKKIKYIFFAPFRELMEEYFMLICPGSERLIHIADAWNIDRNKCFISGHPRNYPLYASKFDPLEKRILYAPTYRWNSYTEQNVIENMFNSLDEIEEKMKNMQAEFVVRLHPLTWRSYENRINAALKNYSHIKFDNNKDIYETLGSYSIMITDYSSIAYDFIMLNRPVIFYVFDLDIFLKQDVLFNYPFFDYTPGPKTKNWEETLSAVQSYIKNPKKDSKWREKIANEFFEKSKNDIDNSKRIVNELKRRLKI